METRLLLAWTFYPSVVLGCLVVLGIYFFHLRELTAAGIKWPVGKSINFALGVLCIFLALCSPIDALSDGYLFSAHMVQHILLHLVAPLLLVVGLPAETVNSWLRFAPVRFFDRLFSNALIALPLAVATLWIWHYPPFFNATLENELLHIFEHLTLLVSGTILWWPPFKPVPEQRLSPAAAMAYIFGLAAADGLLGIIFTIADTPFYAGYAQPHDELGILPLLRDKWGLIPLEDQKAGGAIMWGLGSVIFVWTMMMAMIEWYREPESDPEAAALPTASD